MLPKGDKTPTDWVLARASLSERIKKPLRYVLYPAYLKLINPILQKRFDPSGTLGVDQWYWGHRGLEYELLRFRIERLCGIKGKLIMIAGCGTGKDLATWLNHQPLGLIGVDYFSYQRAWGLLMQEYRREGGMIFFQNDLDRLENIKDQTLDIVGSDAVLEHLRHLPLVLKQFFRVLRPGGILYATFGPLWYCWGGDHVSGFDNIRSGYNHLLLEPDAYQHYLDTAGRFSHSEHDGRTWISHGLFSYMRPLEYLSALAEAGFEKIHLGCVVEPRAIRCLQQYPIIKSQLMNKNQELDLIVTGMSVVCKKA